MTRPFTTARLALAPVLLLGAIAAGAADRPAGADRRQAAEGPRSCIDITSVQQTHVRDGSTIDFLMRDGRTYRNSLPRACPGLTPNGTFAYHSTNGQLCSIDTIGVIYPGSPATRGPTCGLGKFVPLAKVKPLTPSPTGGR